MEEGQWLLVVIAVAEDRVVVHALEAGEVFDAHGSLGAGRRSGKERKADQREIERSAYEAQKRIESGQDVVVGVNRFTLDEPAVEPAFALDPATETRAIERVRAFRRSRDGARTRAALGALAEALSTDENLVGPVLACVEARATVGEILQTMEDRFGRYLGR